MGLFKQLRETEPFNQLPDEVFTEFSHAAIQKKIPAHVYIFNQHDQPTGYLYVIKSGLVEIVALTPGGVQMVVDYRKEGSFFGGTPIFTNEPYTAGARTVRETECYLIPRELLLQAASRYPRISEYFVRAVYSRIRNLYSEMVNDHTQQTLTRMEAYPFKKRLSEIMTTAVETCQTTTPVQEIARQFTRGDVGAVMVGTDSDQVAGIVTEHDLVTKVLARALPDLQTMTAAEVMTPKPFTMSTDSYMYEATSFMLRHKIKHVPVVDQGELVGLVTLRDLMRYRSQKSMLLVGRVAEAKSLDELALIRREVVNVAKALMSEVRSHFETVEILSYIHHCILQRCFDLVLAKSKSEGRTPPDIRFCLFIMGSGGRREMLLLPDQDNGLIFEDYPDAMQKEVDAFFVPFAEELVAAFAQVGYPRCNGEVMINNPLWRGRLKEWRARVTDWMEEPEPKKVMYSTIFFDFMPLTGDSSLCQDLRVAVYKALARYPAFMYFLLENDLKNRPPLGLLGRFLPEKEGEHKGEISLKLAGSIFIVDCVRMFLLEQGVDATTTVERIEELAKLNILNQETAEHLKAALEAFTFLRLRREIELIELGKEPNHYVDPHALSKNEQEILKEAFRVAGKLQDSAKRHFGQGIL
ncbi:MAG: CBS domain-containing protein [Desulfuromonadales bacterium]|nr:CBS domain-containing protein [Desulfuromonadales bacterium]